MKVNGPVAGVILWNESDFVDAILENENGSCVGVILENESDSCDVRILRNSLDVGVSYIDWIPHHNSPPRNRSTSWSLSSNYPCPVAPDTVRNV